MKICIATGTRAEYGLLKPLIDQISANSQLTLQLLVTGAHLSPEFGLTYRQIEEDGLVIDSKVEMLMSSDTSVGIIKSMGLGMIGYADELEQLKPDLIVILGDRYEMLALASASLISRIPIVHIHGGEITEGAYDDSIRHAITKMSHLHFTSTEEYRKRVIQMGEQPNKVYNVGAIGLDNIYSLPLLKRGPLEDELKISFCKYNYIVAFHPETLSDRSVEDQFKSLLQAIDQQEDSFFIFTKSNADTNGRIINEMMEYFCGSRTSKSKIFSSLGSIRFLSLLKEVDAIIGNSSSGIIEAPSLKTGTINIGDRQKGRIQASSVINCSSFTKDILIAFDKLKSKSFRESISAVESPYGNGGTSSRILEIINSNYPSSFKIKTFHNV